MICPDRCTMELIGTYRGIKINQVYKCKWCTVTSYRSVEMDKKQLIAEMAVENAELRETLSQLNGLFAQDGVGIVEPLEGFAKRPQDLKRCVEELIDKLAARDAELERVRSDRGKLASAATLVVSNWDIFEMQDTTARQVFGSSVGWLRDALASPAGEPNTITETPERIREALFALAKDCASWGRAFGDMAVDGITPNALIKQFADKRADQYLEYLLPDNTSPAAEPKSDAILVPAEFLWRLYGLAKDGGRNSLAHDISSLLSAQPAPVAQSQEPNHD